MADTTLIPMNLASPYLDSIDSYSLVITKPGGSTPTKVSTGGVQASWALTPPTTLSGEVSTPEVMRLFGTWDLRGLWGYWTHPALGTWGGEIQECEPDVETGTLELGLQDFSALLEATRLAKDYDPDNAAPAGSWVKRLLVDARREGSAASWISAIAADETGDQLKVPARGGSLFDAFRSLESRSGDEWYVDANLKLWWQKDRGRDQSHRVLQEGVHIAEVRPTLSLRPIINDLRVVPADEAYKKAESFVLQDDASIDRYGPRQGELVYTGLVTESTLRPVAAKDLRRLTKMGGTVRFTCANVGNCFTWFGDGDTIVLGVPSLNWRPLVRILARSYDSEEKTLDVTASVEAMTA